MGQTGRLPDFNFALKNKGELPSVPGFPWFSSWFSWFSSLVFVPVFVPGLSLVFVPGSSLVFVLVFALVSSLVFVPGFRPWFSLPKV